MNKNFILPVMMALFVVVLLLNRIGGRDELSTFSGIAATVLLIVANVYVPARLIVRCFGPLKGNAALFFEKYLTVHMVLNMLAFLAVTIHGHYAGERNLFLTASFIVLIALTVEGLVMHYKVAPGVEDRMAMLQMQRLLFVVWILLAVIGHSYL